jgi:hypothetical protein
VAVVAASAERLRLWPLEAANCSSRELLAARLEAHLASGDVDGADRLLGELRSLPALPLFQASIDSEQKLIFSSDAVVQQDIKQMFDRLSATVRSHLDNAPIEALAEKVKAARASGAKAG